MSDEGGAGLRALVDHDECFSFGFCVEALPDVFFFDEAGKSVARDVDADPDRLAAAADSCPRSAIALIRPASRGGRVAG